MQPAVSALGLLATFESTRIDGQLSEPLAIDAFSEHQFEPAPHEATRYWAMVVRGYEVMRSRRVVIAGLARNIGATLFQTVARIERLGQLFGEYRVVIYENDSNDETKEQLDLWTAMNSNVTVLSEVRQDPINPPTRCPQRGHRMADYRNLYRAHIADSYREFDHVLVVDTDLTGGWSYDGVANTFGHNDWDFVGSYGLIYHRIGLDPNRLLQYDAWAFRLDPSFHPLSTKEVNRMRWQRGNSLVNVTSCFGGLGIYRTEAFLAGKYAGGDCEHIALHRRMREEGFDRSFLNPSQITMYGRRHRKMDHVFSHCLTAVKGLAKWRRRAAKIGDAWLSITSKVPADVSRRILRRSDQSHLSVRLRRLVSRSR